MNFEDRAVGYKPYRRLRSIAIPPAARNQVTKPESPPVAIYTHPPARPVSMVITPSPHLSEIKRCTSETQHLSPIKGRKKSITMERLEDRQLRVRNSISHQREMKLDYQLSADLRAMQQNSIAKAYGDPTTVIKSVIAIQREWRKYCLNKRFTRIKLETPYRTKSMNNAQKPIINVTRDSNENLSNTSFKGPPDTPPEIPSIVEGEEAVQTTSTDFKFKRNDLSRQIIRNKASPLMSSSSDYSLFSQVPALTRRRHTDSSCTSATKTTEIDGSRTAECISNSPWSSGDSPTKTSPSTSVTSSPSVDRPSPLGERVSGDGAESPDDPIREVFKYAKLHAEITSKYSKLWNLRSRDPEQIQLARNYKLGVHKFNRHPSTGIKHLTSTGVVTNTPYDIAAFLLNGKGLSLTQIGNFITDLRKQMSMEVLDEFLKQINFKDLPFDQGLRHFISKLRLPGEAQKIDKLMQAFAERYCQCNPNVISDTQDTIYVLAFSVIILQTDLHNPQIKLHRKMDLESFINNNKGIDNGKDLPRDLLEAIYEGVRKEPIISGRDHLDFLESIDKSIIGKKMNLMDNSRMLMMSTKMQEVVNRNEKPLPDKHMRHVFLFNDLLMVTKILQVRGKATTKTSNHRAISTSSFQYRQHFMICSFKPEVFNDNYYPYGIRFIDSYDDSKVLMELACSNEDDRIDFLAELHEVTWVYRALENDRIGNLGISEKLTKSTLSLHSFNSDSEGGRRHANTLGRRFFKTGIFRTQRRESSLGPAGSLFYTKGISSSDVRTTVKNNNNVPKT